MQNVDLLQSIRFLQLKLQVDSNGVLSLLTAHPRVLVTGVTQAFEALLAVLPVEEADLKVR